MGFLLFLLLFIQELLTYLAMFVKTHSALFDGMLQVRIGLIMEVMAAEYARTTGLTGTHLGCSCFIFPVLACPVIFEIFSMRALFSLETQLRNADIRAKRKYGRFFES